MSSATMPSTTPWLSRLRFMEDCRLPRIPVTCTVSSVAGSGASPAGASCAQAGAASAASSAEVSIVLRGTALYVFMEAPSPGNSVVSLRRLLDGGLLHVAGLERRLTALSTNCHQVRLGNVRAGRDVTVAMNALMLMNCLWLQHLQRFLSHDSAANRSLHWCCAVQNGTARMQAQRAAGEGVDVVDSAGQTECPGMSCMSSGWRESMTDRTGSGHDNDDGRTTHAAPCARAGLSSRTAKPPPLACTHVCGNRQRTRRSAAAGSISAGAVRRSIRDPAPRARR